MYVCVEFSIAQGHPKLGRAILIDCGASTSMLIVCWFSSITLQVRATLIRVGECTLYI